MVRTKADTTGVKVSGAKAPRKALSSTPIRSVSGESDGKSKSYSGGNAYHPRETPEWQKSITTFFICPASSGAGGSSNSKEQTAPETTSSETDH